MYRVLIASHIKQHLRFITLQHALKSIENNSKKPDYVHISISFDDSCVAFKDIKDLSNQFDLNIVIDIWPSGQRKLQFEHYKFLCDKYVEDNDIISFLDDDDLYHEKKIETIKEIFDEGVSVVQHNTLDFYCDENLIPKFKECFGLYDMYCHEYFNLNMKGCIFKDWFTETKKYCGDTFENIIKRHRGFTDVVFNISIDGYYTKLEQGCLSGIIRSVSGSCVKYKKIKIPLYFQRSSQEIIHDYHNFNYVRS